MDSHVNSLGNFAAGAGAEALAGAAAANRGQAGPAGPGGVRPVAGTLVMLTKQPPRSTSSGLCTWSTAGPQWPKPGRGTGWPCVSPPPSPRFFGVSSSLGSLRLRSVTQASGAGWSSPSSPSPQNPARGPTPRDATAPRGETGRDLVSTGGAGSWDGREKAVAATTFAGLWLGLR